jgi:integral membrane protein (TIGR01906 family)
MNSTGAETRPMYRFLSWLVTLLVPIALVLTAVRLLLTPAFVHLEYRTPNFPRDIFGFSLEERLYWSQIALDYLLNNEGIDFLADLRFPDGSQVYNDRELIHMIDVKLVVQAALNFWYVSLAGLLFLLLWALRGGWTDAFLHGLARGGWFTIFVVGAIILIVLIGFGFFFVFFHDVFFDPGTWTFEFSDTLIRLFPERFWRDAFLAIGTISVLCGLALAFGLRRK